MDSKRAAGILLHPTCFPSPYGIGDFGTEAYRFIDFLEKTGQTLWQILPLNPTGYGNSPYAAASAFAGNPLLIDPEILVGEGLLLDEDLKKVPEFTNEAVEYDRVEEWKNQLFRRSFERFKASDNAETETGTIQQEFRTFEAENSYWLEDYALFVAGKKAHEGAAWSEWDPDLRQRTGAGLDRWRGKMAGEIAIQKFIQFLFFRQWMALKTYANERQIQIVGDAPIFVAYDSADVWANPGLFYLDEQGQPTVVSGTPPDDFSETGQYWGNPLYRWDTLAQDDYRWWVDRLKLAFTLVDIIRLDHFRGFEAYWEIPVNEKQLATNGHWVKGPGIDFFQKVREKLGDKPLIAEDLGTVTPEVEDLRKKAGFPGMAVLLFAFSFDAENGNVDLTNPYLPHNISENVVIYTGNHDTDTAAGWFASINKEAQEKVLGYLGQSHRSNDGEKEEAEPLPGVEDFSAQQEAAWEFVRAAYASVAQQAVVPLQDLLGLGSESRMNKPGQAEGNWTWRVPIKALDDVNLYRRLGELTKVSGRCPCTTD